MVPFYFSKCLIFICCHQRACFCPLLSLLHQCLVTVYCCTLESSRNQLNVHIIKTKIIKMKIFTV